MSKKAFKSQASSSRAATGAFGALSGNGSLGGSFSGFGKVASSPLSYVYEPPDLSGISDPNIVVAFKNAQKKDGTTKAKALEDLQTYIDGCSKATAEDGVLEAWIKVYPRTSIDVSRRVRQLAHSLQGHIAAVYGKRLAKHMSAVVPAWLAGQYDPDKSVNRAAQESFSHVFASDEKLKTLWLVYQAAIVEYVRNIVRNENVNTLSDDRTTSPDEASAKYTRVVGCGIIVLTNLLDSTSPDSLDKSEAALDELLAEPALWKLANHPDAYVRNALYGLLRTCLQKRKHVLDPRALSAVMLTTGLHSSQMGSSISYVKSIILLTQAYPTIWTTDYDGAGKKSAINRLRHYLRQGSQGGPPEFWSSVAELLLAIPRDLLSARSDDVPTEQPADNYTETALVLLASLQEGIVKKEELRANSADAWNAYLAVCDTAIRSQSDLFRPGLCRSHIVPLIDQYVRPSRDRSQWAISGTQQQRICTKAVDVILGTDTATFEAQWQTLSSQLMEDLKTSLPEQSKEYTKSQDFVANEGSRWYHLQAAILGGASSSLAEPCIRRTSGSEVVTAVTVLTNRNGKPYGAAATLLASLESIPSIVLCQQAVKNALTEFLHNTIPVLMNSPSATYLVKVMNHMPNDVDLAEVYLDCGKTLEEAPESQARTLALQTLLASTGFGKSGGLSKSNVLLQHAIDHAIEDDDKSSWSLVMAVIGNPLAPKDTTDDILTSMMEGLSIDKEVRASLHGLSLTIKHNKDLLRDFSIRPEGSGLLTKVLSKADSPDAEDSLRAQKLSVDIEAALAATGDPANVAKPFIDIIKRELESPSLESLPIDSLVSQAQKVLKQTDQDQLPIVLAELLPSTAQWTDALAVHTSVPPNVSISTCTAFGGAVYLINDQQTISASEKRGSVSQDRDGRSQLLRLMEYATLLLRNSDGIGMLTAEIKSSLVQNVVVALALASDNTSIPGSNATFSVDNPEAELDMVAIINDAHSVADSWTLKPTMSAAVSSAITGLLNRATGSGAPAYYYARAFASLAAKIIDQGDRVPLANEDDRLREIRKSPDTFLSLAIVSSVDGKEALRLCNGLLSDLTGVEISNPEDINYQVLSYLVLLNGLLQRPDQIVEDVPQQRLVFYVQHIVKQMVNASEPILVEIWRSLFVLLPLIKEIYGSFWAKIVESLHSHHEINIDDGHIPTVHGSLRLLSLLRKSSMQEGNDDLLDAWTERRDSIAEYELQLMVKLQRLEDHSHQPRRIVNELLCRELTNTQYDFTDQTATLFPVLTSESTSLQTAAFDLLHGYIPSKQEQISLDKALTKDYQAHLPEELLSLILTRPSVHELTDIEHDRPLASHLRSFLLSWLIIFDHWVGASNMLQMDYARSLGESTYLNDLLDMMFEVLITNRSRPIDTSKYTPESYMPDPESEEKDINGLLIHLYYLCLRYLPTQTKTWWRDSASRQVNIAVQSWTEKSISRLIIDTELGAIREWAPSQTTDEHPMTVKVSLPAREVTASIPVDEQTMILAIRMPPAYPLARAEVEGVHRVGVPEKKWVSWIRNAQGQLTIASEGGGNALIDCLLAWRKNVVAAMKGQSECAICYSVVGADRTLPSKVCKTCKNKFHGSCLFRWFSSSNSSSCPLCRNTFTYS